MPLRRPHLTFQWFVRRQMNPDFASFDPRAEEFDDVAYDDVLRRCTPDPDEPTSNFEYFGGRR